MAIFKDLTERGKTYLVVLRDAHAKAESGIKLQVCPSIRDSSTEDLPPRDNKEASQLYGELPRTRGDPSYTLRSPLNSRDARKHEFSTLGHRIISNEVQWGSQLKTQGAFVPSELYCGWLEDVLSRNHELLKQIGLHDALYASLFTYARDHHVIRAFCEAWCPETNTLHTDVGELSISLTDLQEIGGLPISGDLYEEVIPSSVELLGPRASHSKSLPDSCQYLFAAFLECQEEVCDRDRPKASIAKWIDFWCRKPNPVKGATVKDAPCQSSEKDEIPFNILQIRKDLRDETYLAALVACWLCTFGLPAEGSFIRPSTFKMASLIARGQTRSLAIPVLVSIYRGLNRISRSSTPERAGVFIPWHYIFGWLARYLGTHRRDSTKLSEPLMVRFSGASGSKAFTDQTARDLIHGGHDVDWLATATKFERTVTKFDDGQLSIREKEFFLAVRSGILVFHCHGSCWVEPYNPCRSARQFGFHQGVPAELVVDARSTSLARGWGLWAKFIAPRSGSKLVFPTASGDITRHVSQGYWAWWGKVHGSYLFDGRQSLINTVNRTAPRPKQNAPTAKVKEIKSSHPPTSSPNLVIRLPSAKVTKGKEMHADLREKRCFEVVLDASGSSSHGDRNWKRPKPGVGKQLVCRDPVEVGGSVLSEDFANGPDALAMEASKIGRGRVSPVIAERRDAIPSTNDVDLDCDPDLEGTAETETVIFDGDHVSEHRVMADGPSKRDSFGRGPTSAPLALLAPPPEVSEFQSSVVISKGLQSLHRVLWTSACQKISCKPIDQLASIKKGVYEIFSEMERVGGLDLSNAKALLDTVFENAAHYKAALDDVSSRLSQEAHGEKLSILCQKLKESETSERECLQHTRSSQDKLTDVQERRKTLEKELLILKREEDQLVSSLSEHETELQRYTAQSIQLRDEITNLENTPSLQPDESDALERMRELLEGNRRDLKNYKLFS